MNVGFGGLAMDGFRYHSSQGDDGLGFRDYVLGLGLGFRV